ncbi:excalibur calcium-binding domain-containing protein [Metabacillus litoralis]|uniref:excalibur calcium-binding domain-containing protein n=1 Tax=Metabacillus litoralis TaxID=152268 RepID=UPI0020422AE1|nr:excalibur calcium-binding domain-containing protein [Metabacillus litoralis]MCM3651284.1 excalibur calcium-binding domain-containing protein [Metabacillus litoralis]
MATAVFIIGFSAFIFSLIYLLYHFIRKIKDKERKLSRKLFFPLFIGGFILFIFGASFADTGTQGKLNDALKENTKLSTDNKTLTTKNEELEKRITELETEIKDASSKITEYENNLKSIEEEKTSFTSEKEALNQQISDLTTSNTNLQSEVDSLKSQLASAKSTASSSNNSTSTNSSSSTNNSTASASSGAREDFANCTDLRGTYPNGVPSGHPAYVPSMDRDKDGYACER